MKIKYYGVFLLKINKIKLITHKIIPSHGFVYEANAVIHLVLIKYQIIYKKNIYNNLTVKVKWEKQAIPLNILPLIKQDSQLMHPV